MDSPEVLAALAVSVSLRLLVIYLGLVFGSLLFSESAWDRRLVLVAIVATAAASVPRILGIVFSLAQDRWMTYASLLLAFGALWAGMARVAAPGRRRGLYVSLVPTALLAVFSLTLL